MSPDVTLALLAGVPVLILMLLRVNATLVFLSACLGAVLLLFVGADANDFFAMFLPSVDGNNLKLGLLLLPVVLTTILMIRTVQGSKLLFNLLPALGFGFLLALLVVPLLPPGESFALRGSQTWHVALQLQSLVIGASALICLLFLWMQRPKDHHGKHGKHHKL
jgi:hypothetical protein